MDENGAGVTTWAWARRLSWDPRQRDTNTAMDDEEAEEEVHPRTNQPDDEHQLSSAEEPGSVLKRAVLGR